MTGKFTLLMFAIALPACSGPDIKVVKANPSAMYALGSKRSSQGVVVRSGAPAAPSAKPSHHFSGSDKLRLPDMEDLPSESELKSGRSGDAPSGGIIARPPTE